MMLSHDPSSITSADDPKKQALVQMDALSGDASEVNVLVEHDDPDQEERYVPKWLTYKCMMPIVFVFTYSSEMAPMFKRQWTVLLVVCVIGFGNQFDSEIFPMSLVKIQESLSMSDSQVGIFASFLLVGNMLAVFAGPALDLFGRRRVIIVSVVMYTCLTFISAFQQHMWSFGLFQMLSRCFLNIQMTTSVIFLVEEFDSDKRGLGIGILSGISAAGAGVSLLFNGFVGDNLWGWRVLYGVGALQLLFIPYTWKHLPESTMFSEDAAEQSPLGDVDLGEHAVLRKVPAKKFLRTMRVYWKRFACCSLVAFCNGFAYSVANTYKIKFMQEVHGYSAAQVSIASIVVGALALVAFPMAGKMSDKFGRKKFILLFNLLVPLGVLGYYNVPGPMFLVFYFLQMQGNNVLTVVSNTYFGEVFPTSIRGTSQVLFVLISFLGQAIAVALETLAYEHFKSHWKAVNIMLLPAILSGPTIFFFLPETSNRDLHDVSPEVADDEDFERVQSDSFGQEVELVDKQAQSAEEA